MQHLLPSNRCELLFTHGKGAYLYEQNGEKYLDMISGVAVNVFGHGDEKITEIASEQISKATHISNYFRSQELEYAASRLAELTIGGRVFFANSGAESVETAIKTARRYWYVKGLQNKHEIICFKKSFHGRTLGAIAAQGNEKYLEGFEPRLPGFRHAELNNIASVEALISPITAAIMLEPVQGEGGVMVANTEFLKDVKALCKKNDMLLIFDEVQCGVGRTGSLYSFHYHGVIPDILVTAKGLGAGIPIGACVAREDVGITMSAGTHGSTFGGNPLATKIASYVLDTVSKPEFLAHINNSSQEIIAIIKSVTDKIPSIITEIRGCGLLLGIRISEEFTTQEFVSTARKNKLLLAPCSADNVVRILPRLNVTTQEIADFRDKLINTLEDLSRKSDN